MDNLRTCSKSLTGMRILLEGVVAQVSPRRLELLIVGNRNMSPKHLTLC